MLLLVKDCISFNYYPFGMQMPEREYSISNDYRYGFNGKERDNEDYGEGKAYDFGARIYDPRLGRWMSVDPLQAKHAGESPYLFVGGNPILYIDPDGKDRITTVNHYNQAGVLVRHEVITKYDANQIIAKETTTKSSIMGGGSSPVIKRDWYNVGQTVNIYEDDKGKEISRTTSADEAVGDILTTTHGEGTVIDNATWATSVIKLKSVFKFRGGEGDIMFYAKGGQGQETMKGSIEHLNMVEINGLLQAVSSGKELAPFETVSEDLSERIPEDNKKWPKWLEKLTGIKKADEIEQCESCKSFKKDGKEYDTSGKGTDPATIKQVPIKEFHKE